MFGGIPFNYREKLEETGKLPHIEVSEEEFVKIMVENGHTEKEAKFQAKISRIMEAHTQIGNQMVMCKKG